MKGERILRALDGIYLACIWIAGLAILAMALVIPWGIFARYVLGTGSQWPEPIAILLMVVFTFIGAAASYRAGAHIAVGVVTERVPPALQALLARLVHGLMVAICVFLVWWGTKLCIATWNQSLSELPWLPVGLTYSPVPLGGLLTLLFVLEHIFFGPQNARAAVGTQEAQAH